MDNGEMRLSGMLDGMDEPTEEELELTRQELLAGAEDPNTPNWNVAVGGKGIRPDILLDLNFASDPNTPIAIEIKKGIVNELRRFFTSIFSS